MADSRATISFVCIADVLSHGSYAIMNFLEVSSFFKLTNLDILIVLSCSICFKLFFFQIDLFNFYQVLLQDKQFCEINMVKNML